MKVNELKCESGDGVLTITENTTTTVLAIRKDGMSILTVIGAVLFRGLGGADCEVVDVLVQYCPVGKGFMLSITRDGILTNNTFNTEEEMVDSLVVALDPVKGIREERL